jgi:hypothetical protein
MTGLVVRSLLVIGGLLIMLGGIAALVLAFDVFNGLLGIGFGAAIVLAVAFERQRYRSEAAEQSNAEAGPGGGETPGTRLESRFRPTDEVFIDPTTNQRMRVLLDPATGERRYIAEA